MKRYIAIFRPFYRLGGDQAEAFNSYFDALDWLTALPAGTKTIIVWYP